MENVFNYTVTLIVNGKKINITDFYLQDTQSPHFAFAKVTIFDKIVPVQYQTVKISFKTDETEDIFNGFIDACHNFKDKSILFLKEGSKDLHYQKIIQSYRRETAQNILVEILQKMNINNFNINFIDCEIDRFPIYKENALLIIQRLKQIIKDYTNQEILSFFDKKGVFHFVEKEKYILKTKTISFLTKKNITNDSVGIIECLPTNIRANNSILINFKNYTSIQTFFEFIDGKGRSKIYYETND